MKEETVCGKECCRFALAVLMTLFWICSAHAETGPWMGPIDPGGGGQVVDIEVDPQNDEHLFVLINAGGLRRSTDGGQTWTILNLGMNYEESGYKASCGQFIGLHPDEMPHVLLRSSRNSEIFLSTDGGNSWEISYAVGDPDVNCKFGDFTYDPDNPDVVYTAGGGNNNILNFNYGDKELDDNRILRGVYDPANKRYTWTVVLDDMGALENEWVHSMDVSKEGGRTYLYLTGPFGLYKGELIQNGDQFEIDGLEPLHAPIGMAAFNGLPASQHLGGCKVVADDHTGRIYLTVGNWLNIDGGVYRSEDFGATFNLLTDEEGYDPLGIGKANTRFFEFAISPFDPTVLYACMVRYAEQGAKRSGTLMRSTDDGATWHPMMLFENMEMGWKDHSAIKNRFAVNRIASSRINEHVFYASTGAGSHLYRSDDATAADPHWIVKSTRLVSDGSPTTWTGGYPAISFQWSIAVNPFDPDMVIVPYGDHGIFVSEDGGQSMGLWVEHGPDGIGETYGGTIVVDEMDPSVWYYALQGPHMKVHRRLSEGAVIKLVNYGSSWTYLGGNKEGDDQGFPRGAACDMLIEYGDNGDRTVYVTNYNKPTSNGGVYQKTNDDAFTMIFKKGESRAIAQRDNFSYLYVGADTRGLFRLKRSGEYNWIRKRLGTPGEGLCGNVFYAMKTGHESGNIYCATDIGLVVIDRNDRLVMLKEGAHYWDVAINPHDENIVYLVTDHGEGVLRSTDRGHTWSSVSEGLPTLNTIRLAVDPVAPDTIYVGTKSAGIWKRSFSGQ